ncbi:hypothetical protein BCR32DRAFT_247266 [Anaeromyces robustus]|uniref:Uncharacterized protein n=1 Tax=Anaeromyces robustus TaxID=1754192 RepID=A0A1Y1WY50_9FUNG|nr:hypothetical protein BCR32DRAFT_247266 [Anaeromyces robustus]|eukprot:ORX78305.1 hypothetical protein BCR32DRAFT_247266 [Anaeromyces robustus]
MVNLTNRTLLKRYHYEIILPNDIEPNSIYAVRDWVIGVNNIGLKIKLKNIQFKSIRTTSTTPPYDPPLLVYFKIVRSGYHNSPLAFLMLNQTIDTIPYAFLYDGFDSIRKYTINKEIVLNNGDALYIVLKSLEDNVYIPTTDSFHILVEEEISYL